MKKPYHKAFQPKQNRRVINCKGHRFIMKTLCQRRITSTKMNGQESKEMSKNQRRDWLDHTRSCQHLPRSCQGQTRTCHDFKQDLAKISLIGKPGSCQDLTNWQARILPRLFKITMNFTGVLVVQWLAHMPFTSVTRVRFLLSAVIRLKNSILVATRFPV